VNQPNEHTERCKRLVELVERLPDDQLEQFLDPNNIQELQEFLQSRAAWKIIRRKSWSVITVIAAVSLAVSQIWDKVIAGIRALVS